MAWILPLWGAAAALSVLAALLALCVKAFGAEDAAHRRV